MLFHSKCIFSRGILQEQYPLVKSIRYNEHFQSKLAAASQCGARTPLSPVTQATIEKHLPGLPSRRLLMQQAYKSPPKVEKRDVACCTDVCSADNLPEVEIFSLLEEKIPKYRVRADITTTFGGYENQDWFVNYPALPIPQDGLGLTAEQTREALNYFHDYWIEMILIATLMYVVLMRGNTEYRSSVLPVWTVYADRNLYSVGHKLSNSG